MPRDPDPRLLRAFAAVADELHFTRAAARLFVAQQALSRDIRRLEKEWGTTLFDRTTRQVRPTPEALRLLPRVRAVLAAYDGLAADSSVTRPLTVDVAAPVSTGREVLREARRLAPDTEFVVRYRAGLTGAAAEITAGRLDVSFGRAAGLPAQLLSGLRQLPVRMERVGVLLPEGHRLAPLPRIPLAALAGESLYAAAGNEAAAEWTDFARTLFDGYGIALLPPFPGIEGEEEFARIVTGHRWPVLATEVFMEIPRTVLRPLTAPVPLSPVSLVHRRGLRHPGIDALVRAARTLAARHDWLARPPGHWLPPADAALLGPKAPV